jgi:AraC family transcriptional regulator of adaptative response / DNA-3-methyladenine glycosylase II
MLDVAQAAGYGSVRRFNAEFRKHHLDLNPTQLRARVKSNSAWLSLRLAYRPPLDFETMLAFAAKRMIPGIEAVGQGAYFRSFGAADASSWLRVRKDPKRHELLLDISYHNPSDVPDMVQRVRRMFDLDANPEAIAQVFEHDPVLAKACTRRPGLRVPGCFDPFELAMRAILGQQVSVAGATTLAKRLLERFGSHRVDVEKLPWEMPLQQVFPTPARLAEAELELIGVPRTRAQAMRGLARAVADGSLLLSAERGLDDFVARITKLPGIGPWTAHYLAMRGLQCPDAFPAGDLVLQQVLAQNASQRWQDKLRLSEKDCEQRSQAWRPWRAYAVLQLWHLANDLKGVG